MLFWGGTCRDEAVDGAEERPWEPAERIYARCQSSTSLLHTGGTWDDCIQSFLSTLSQTEWDRESRREIKAAAEVSNNLHLICFSSSLPVLSHFMPQVARQRCKCADMWGLALGSASVWLLPMNLLPSRPRTPLFFSFPSPSSPAAWRNWPEFSGREMRGAASSQEQQQPWAFIKAGLRNDHSAVGKLSWPRGQAVSGYWWEGQRGQAILVPPT